MYLYRLLFVLWMPTVFSTNSTKPFVSPVVVGGYDPEIDYDISDVPRMLKTGRKHCFKSPNLYCAENRRCCTHVHQKKIWCCDRKHKCGKTPKTCVVQGETKVSP